MTLTYTEVTIKRDIEKDGITLFKKGDSVPVLSEIKKGKRVVARWVEHPMSKEGTPFDKMRWALFNHEIKEA